MYFSEFLLVFTASSAASLHCAGMCGGFTLSLVGQGRAAPALLRMAVYHGGKLFTYLFIGMLAGLAGVALLNNPALQAAQLAFSILAGALIVAVGLQTVGLLPGPSLFNRLGARLWLGPFFGPLFKSFRSRRSLDGPFFLGVFNGWLPCGLIYAFALAAAGSRSLGGAMLTMLAFGLGTAPILVAVGLVGAGLPIGPRLRPTLRRAAGVLLIALGTITALRGTPAFMDHTARAASGHTAHAASGHTLGHQAPFSTELRSEVGLEPAAAPEFTLTDQDGRPVSLVDYRGKVVLLDFIYTSCTTTCPRLTGTFRTLQSALGAQLGRNVALISITVDPTNDTAEVLRAYAAAHGADPTGWTFLTGRPDAVLAVSRAYAVHVGPAPAGGIAHSETILLIDKHGRLRAAFGLLSDPEAILARVGKLTRER